MANTNRYNRIILANYILVFREYNNAVHDGKDPGKIINVLKKMGHSVELISKERVSIKGVKNYNHSTFLYLALFLIKRACFSRSRFFFFHIKHETVLLANLVLFTGEVVIKMDNCNRAGPYPWENWLNSLVKVNSLYYNKKLNVVVRNIYKYGVQRIFARANLLTVEDEGTHQEYKRKYNITCRFEVVPNLVEPSNEILNKEKIILHVARIGDWSKNSELVVRSFLSSEICGSYKLILAGTMTKEFKEWFESINDESISYVGILSTGELQQLYKKSMCLFLPSKLEAFANVFSESLAYGLNIITSKNTAIANYNVPGLTVLEDINLKNLITVLNGVDFVDHAVVRNWYIQWYRQSNKLDIYG